MADAAARDAPRRRGRRHRSILRVVAIPVPSEFAIRRASPRPSCFYLRCWGSSDGFARRGARSYTTCVPDRPCNGSAHRLSRPLSLIDCNGLHVEVKSTEIRSFLRPFFTFLTRTCERWNLLRRRGAYGIRTAAIGVSNRRGPESLNWRQIPGRISGVASGGNAGWPVVGSRRSCLGGSADTCRLVGTDALRSPRQLLISRSVCLPFRRGRGQRSRLRCRG